MEKKILREKIMRVIFQMEAHGIFDYEKLDIIEEDKKITNNKRAIEIFQLIKDHHLDIDIIIEEHTSGWTINRISKTDLAILRTAVAEMIYVKEIPIAVSINEAVDIAKKYGNERSFAFINAILRKIGEDIE